MVKRWDGRLERFEAYRLAKRTIKEFAADEGPDRAAAVAYFAILSIFPLLLGLIALLGFFVPSGAIGQAISGELALVLPGSADFVEQNLDSIIRLRGVNGVFALLALLWSGSSLFGAIGRAVNHAWDLSGERKFYAGKLRDIGMLFATGLLFLFSVYASTVVYIIGSIDSRLTYWVVFLGGHAGGFLLVLVVFLLIYKYTPHQPMTWRAIWPGALLAAILFEVGRFFFILYLTTYASYEMVYGSLASVIILLLWVYISAVIMLLGVEFNSESVRMRRGIQRGGRV
jgi:membrane protein